MARRSHESTPNASDVNRSRELRRRAPVLAALARSLASKSAQRSTHDPLEAQDQRQNDRCNGARRGHWWRQLVWVRRRWTTLGGLLMVRQLPKLDSRHEWQ